MASGNSPTPADRELSRTQISPCGAVTTAHPRVTCSCVSPHPSFSRWVIFSQLASSHLKLLNIRAELSGGETKMNRPLQITVSMLPRAALQGQAMKPSIYGHEEDNAQH